MDRISRAKQYSKVSFERLQAMDEALRDLDARDVAGDIVECGVWRGGHIVLARLASPQRRCWLYDTFTGMTEPGPNDMKVSGNKPPPGKALSKKWTMASLEEVMENLRCEGVLDKNLTCFVVGDVCKTLLTEQNLPDKIALLRLDTDWYESTKVELEILYPRLVSGGILIVDDYGHWMGARKAVDDYLGSNNYLKMIDYTGALMIKP